MQSERLNKRGGVLSRSSVGRGQARAEPCADVANFLHVDAGMPLIVAAAGGIGVTTVLGWMTHRFVIHYLLDDGSIVLGTPRAAFTLRRPAAICAGVDA